MMVGGVSIAKIRDPVYPLFQSNPIILRSDSNPLGGMGGIGLLSSREEKISHMCKGQTNTPHTPLTIRISQQIARKSPIGRSIELRIFAIDTPPDPIQPSETIRETRKPT